MSAPKTQDIVAKLWNLCNVLKDDGVTYHQYVNELTYLLFLKMAQETKTEAQIPSGYRWADIVKREGVPLLEHYRLLLVYPSTIEVTDIRLADGNSVIDFDDLSDGESQLLQVLGAIRIFSEGHSLFIFDEDERIFEQQFYDKRPDKFFNKVSELTDAQIYEESLGLAEAWFIRFGQGRDWARKGECRVFVILRVPITQLSNEVTVYRYVSDFEPYRWHEGRTAVQLRAWARLLSVNKDVYCQGREVSHDLGQKIWSNSVFLHEFFSDPSQVCHCRDDWHPEDSALFPEESRAAKPDEFLPAVIEFLKHHNLPHAKTQLFPPSSK